MQRGKTILLVGIIILVSSIIIFGLSAYKAILFIENFPDISVKEIAVKVTDKFVDKVTNSFKAFLDSSNETKTSNDTEEASTQEVREKIMVDVGIIFFAIISGIVLLINGLLAMIIGISIWVHDRRQEV
jgi:hypothetical protein